MKAHKTATGIRTELGFEVPHGLPNDKLLPQLPRHNLFAIEMLGKAKERVSRARLDKKDVFMKTAPLSYQLPFLKQELMVCQRLWSQNIPCVPEFLGYVYEESEDRAIGFVMQAVEGRPPSVADYQMCKDALEKLHATGAYHGDINKYTILITPSDEAVFIDFEGSAIAMNSESEDGEMATKMQAEIDVLYDRLADPSTLYGPYTSSP